jgi:alkylation response protein AidB-like acyl-CoA dehydrogenase
MLQDLAHGIAMSVTTATRPGFHCPVAEDAWQLVVETGCIGLGIDESRGGSGGQAIDAGLVAEQFARGPLPVPFLGTTLALRLLNATGDAGTEIMDTILSGEPAGIIVDSRLMHDGRAELVIDAQPGDLAVGLRGSMVVVGRAGPALDSIDLMRPISKFESIDHEIADLGDDAVARWHAYALSLACADLLGAMHAALDSAVGHAREREQFGRPIGSFQAVQHLCADALVSVEAARSICWNAAWAVDAQTAQEALHTARVAKAWCSEAALDVVEAAIQVWGGTGITWECPVHFLQRRVLLSRGLFGNEDHHFAEIATLLVDRPVNR